MDNDVISMMSEIVHVLLLHDPNTEVVGVFKSAEIAKRVNEELFGSEGSVLIYTIENLFDMVNRGLRVSVPLCFQKEASVSKTSCYGRLGAVKLSTLLDSSLV